MRAQVNDGSVFECPADEQGLELRLLSFAGLGHDHRLFAVWARQFVPAYADLWAPIHSGEFEISAATRDWPPLASVVRRRIQSARSDRVRRIASVNVTSSKLLTLTQSRARHG